MNTYRVKYYNMQYQLVERDVQTENPETIESQLAEDPQEPLLVIESITRIEPTE